MTKEEPLSPFSSEEVERRDAHIAQQAARLLLCQTGFMLQCGRERPLAALPVLGESAPGDYVIYPARRSLRNRNNTSPVIFPSTCRDLRSAHPPRAVNCAMLFLCSAAILLLHWQGERSVHK
ncbi:MAG: hypothetical protein P8Y58_12265 [Novosphingobium sp.]